MVAPSCAQRKSRCTGYEYGWGDDALGPQFRPILHPQPSREPDWEFSAGTQTIGDIHSVLCDHFDIAPERALDDLVTLVNELTQEGLLQQERR
jgi:hypothetical protein